MNVLMVGGARTGKTVQVLEKTLGQTGVFMMTEMYIEDVQNVYNRGDSFDKLIVTAQAWTHNGQYSLDSVYPDAQGNQLSMKEHLINFIADLYNRLNSHQQLIFMPDNEESAEIISSEIIRMTSNAVVVMLPSKLSVQFMQNLILTDINSLPEDIVYHPPIIDGFEDDVVESDENLWNDADSFESNAQFDDVEDGWNSTPDPTFTPNTGDTGSGFDSIDDNDFNVDDLDGLDVQSDELGEDFNEGLENDADLTESGHDMFGDENTTGDVAANDPYMTDDVDPNNGYDDPDSQLNPEFNSPASEMNVQDPYADNYQDSNPIDDNPFGGSTVEIPGDTYGYNDGPGVQVDPYGEMGEQNDPFNQNAGNQTDYNPVDPYVDPYEDTQQMQENPFDTGDQQMQAPVPAPEQMQRPVQNNQGGRTSNKKPGLFGRKNKGREQPPVQAPQAPMQNMSGMPIQDPYGNQGQEDYSSSVYENPYDDVDTQMPQDNDPNTRVLTDVNLNDAAKLFAAFANRGNSIMVTGAPGAGTSTIAYQLANIIRLMNYNVLLVDFDVKGRSQTYISAANYNATDHDESRLAAAVNSSQGINQYVAIAAQNLHLLNLGLDIDDKPIDQVIQKNRVMKFANQAKNGHNFVIYDVPFDYAAGHLEDITTMADNIVIVMDSSTWGAMKTILYMMNVEDDTILETLFSKSSILFNRYRGYPRILGEKIRNPDDILKAMDKELTDLVGADIGYQFRSIHVCGSLGYIDAFENGWLGKEKQQWTATREGSAAFIQILKNIVFRGTGR